MLKNRKPFFLASISGIWDGHAWVVDGSINREQTTRTINNSTGETINSMKKTEYLVHCNWGWGGSCNGYYTSDIFRPQNGPISTEPGVDFTDPGTLNATYRRFFHMITY